MHASKFMVKFWMVCLLQYNYEIHVVFVYARYEGKAGVVGRVCTRTTHVYMCCTDCFYIKLKPAVMNYYLVTVQSYIIFHVCLCVLGSKLYMSCT